MLVKLRINLNDAPIEYDGVSLKIDVQGKTLPPASATRAAACHGSASR